MITHQEKVVVDETVEDMVERNVGNVCVIHAKVNDNTSGEGGGG